MKSPDYYKIPGLFTAEGESADLGDVLDAYGLSYWAGSVLAHVCRAGRKPGETALDAMSNAMGCLEREMFRLQKLGGA